jgi:hypothetical protein
LASVIVANPIVAAAAEQAGRRKPYSLGGFNAVIPSLAV